VEEKLRKNKHKVRKPKEDPIWTLCFDSSKCKLGTGVGIELINTKGKSFYVAYRLYFRCANNVVEYKALIWGLLFALEKGFITLIVKGDS
jgi:ribonuclease HI